MKAFSLKTLSVVAALGLAGASADASLIATDSFWTTADGAGGTYVDFGSQQIFGQNPTAGVAGFTTPWGTSDNRSTNDVRAVNMPNIDHPLVAHPLGDWGGNGHLESRDGGSTNRSQYRQIDNVPSSDRYYISFTMLADGPGSRGHLGVVNQGAYDTAPGGTSGVLVGFADDAIVAHVNGSPTTMLSGIAAQQPYFALIEVANAGAGNHDTITFSLFNAGNADIGSPDYMLVIDDADVTNSLTHLGFLKIANPPSDHSRFDNFRFGTTLDAVAIPEPASVVLLGLGGLIAMTRRRSS